MTRYWIQAGGRMSYQSYRDLEIYQLFHKLAVEAHNMIINKLPKFETHEEG